MTSFRELRIKAQRRLEGTAIKDLRLEQAFIRDTLHQEQLMEGSLNVYGTRVTYDRRLKRVTLSRYLTGKLAQSPEQVNFQELLVIFDNQLWLEDKARHDQGFREKFGSSLEELSTILKSTPNVGTLSSYLRRLSTKIRNSLEGFYLPARNLPTVKSHVEGRFHILPSKSLGTEKRSLPPKSVIGVGYSDKGTRRDPAFDGSPHWTDVAIHFSRMEE